MLLTEPTMPQVPPTLPLSHTSPDTAFNGPMKVLRDLGADDGFDVEIHDSITRQVITSGEASIAFKM
jgi:hypothetical protein